MNLSSVRVRLTLWNVTVLALVLVCFGVALCYSVQASLESTVDRDLAARARGVIARWEDMERWGLDQGWSAPPWTARSRVSRARNCGCSPGPPLPRGICVRRNNCWPP